MDKNEVVETTKSFSLPYKVICSKCGKEKSVRHEVLLKRMVGFKGNLEDRFNQLSMVYECQDCRRESKMKEIESTLK